MRSSRSTNTAFRPVTSAVRSVPSVAFGSVSSRRRPTRSAVACSWAPVVGITWNTAIELSELSWGGVTVATPLVFWTSWTSVVTCAWADTSPDGISTTSRNGSVEPSPKASVCRSQALYWVESVGNSELSRGPRRRSPLNTGMARMSRPTRAAASASAAWRVTKSAQRRMTPSLLGVGRRLLGPRHPRGGDAVPDGADDGGLERERRQHDRRDHEHDRVRHGVDRRHLEDEQRRQGHDHRGAGGEDGTADVPAACPATSTGSSPPTTKSFARPMTNRP